MHLTVKSTKKMAFSSHQSEKKAELVSRLSTILRKKTAEQVRLPIRMALSPPKSCSVDKWKSIVYLLVTYCVWRCCLGENYSKKCTCHRER